MNINIIKKEAPIIDGHYSCEGCVFNFEYNCIAPKIPDEKGGYITDPQYDCFDGKGVWIFLKDNNEY